MKKRFFIALVMMLVCAMIFGSCAGEVQESGTDVLPTDTDGVSDNVTEPDTDPDTDETDGTEATPDPHVVKSSYMPTNISEGLKTMFEQQTASFTTFSYGSCPYVMRDMYVISDCRLLSISVPVSKTLAADANGDFIFTVTVGSNQWYQIQNTPRMILSIKVNGKEHGLSANTSGINKWIKVDVSSYNIVLSKNETIGFGKSSDTLIPAYLGNSETNPAYKLIKQEFPQMRGFISKMGLGTDIGTSNGTLLFDFEWERTYESKEAYDAYVASEAEYRRIVEAVADEYAGKYISILGDSISTYEGFSNDASNNSTTGNNLVYYTGSGAINFRGLLDHMDTYWYRLILDLDMDLCVNNSWSGSRVFDTARMPDRAGELDNDNGTPNDPSDDISPDVIIFYMGINDLHNDEPGQMGDLYEILQSTKDTRSDAEKIEEWLKTVDKDNFTTFEQGYALCLKTMTEKYPDAEIWCLTLNYNGDGRFDKTSMKQYNRCITALGEYFGATVIDQTQGYITQANCVRYSCDNKGLHPNPAGHALMERYIIENFYKKMQKQ